MTGGGNACEKNVMLAIMGDDLHLLTIIFTIFITFMGLVAAISLHMFFSESFICERFQ